ncbi:MAG: rhodanese-like domain-containing protein, partial [Thiohalomonadales bacterium]
MDVLLVKILRAKTTVVSPVCSALSFCLLCLISVTAFATEEIEYPGRILFPDVKYISTNTLARFIKESVVVDVRSPYEYDILHIQDAINIPLASRSFIARIQNLQEN